MNHIYRIFLAALTSLIFGLSGCATYHPNTVKAGFYEAERACKNELELNVASGAAIGGGAGLLTGRLVTGQFYGGDLVTGAIIGGLITHFDNADKIGQCLKTRGY